MLQSTRYAQAYITSGNVCRVEIVPVRYEVHCTLSGIRLRANGRVSIPDHHRPPQYQNRGMGTAACSGVIDRSHYGVLVCYPQTQGVRE